MGKRGPRPAPTRLRVLSGEKRPSRINYAEPVAPDGEPQAPETLSDDARAVWDYTMTQLRWMRIVSPADRDALAVYCEAVVNHRRLTKLVRETAMGLRRANDTVVKNPLVGMMRAEA